MHQKVLLGLTAPRTAGILPRYDGQLFNDHPHFDLKERLICGSANCNRSNFLGSHPGTMTAPYKTRVPCRPQNLSQPQRHITLIIRWYVANFRMGLTLK
jgi:hypothetical protein